MKYLVKVPFIRIWANIFIFKGKETAKQYLIDLLLYAVLGIVILFLWSSRYSVWMPAPYGGVISVFIVLSVLAIPLISMTSRRLYTVGLPWGLCFIILIPILGTLWTLIVSLFNDSKRELSNKSKKEIVTPVIVASIVSPCVTALLVPVLLFTHAFTLLLSPPVVKRSVNDYQYLYYACSTFKLVKKDIIGFGEYKYNSYLLLVPRKTPSTLKKFYYRWSGGIDVDDFGFYFECKLEQEKFDNYIAGLENFTIKVGDTTKKLVKTNDVFDYPTYVVQWNNVGPKWQVFEYIMLDEAENKVIYAFSMSTGYDEIIKNASYNIAPKCGISDVPEGMKRFSIYRDEEEAQYEKYYQLDEMIYDISFLNSLF